MRIITLQLLYVIAWAGGQVPQQVSSPPDIEVVSARWTMSVFKPVATRPSISSETIEKSERVNDPMPPQVPTPNVSGKAIERQSYTYSAEILNRGQKEVKALIWSFVFSDPVTHEELERRRGFTRISISPSQKKTVKHTTPSSPPRLVNANAPKASSPFAERVIIECVLYADGSLWESPEGRLKVIAKATGQWTDLCENLRK